MPSSSIWTMKSDTKSERTTKSQVALSLPWMTWIGSVVSLSPLLLFAAIQMGSTDSKESLKSFAVWTLHVAPIVGLLCLMVAAMNEEKRKKLRTTFIVIYVVWLVFLAFAWLESLTSGIRRGPGGSGFLDDLPEPMRSC